MIKYSEARIKNSRVMELIKAAYEKQFEVCIWGAGKLVLQE